MYGGRILYGSCREGSNVFERSTGQTWNRSQQKLTRLADQQGSSLSVCAEVFRSCLSALTSLIKVLKAANYLNFNRWHFNSLEHELPVMFG